MIRRPELSETLIAMAGAVMPRHDSLAVEEVEITAPMLVRLEHGADGPCFVAHPPYSIWRSGFEPVAHSMTLRFGAAEENMNNNEEEMNPSRRPDRWG